MTRIWLAGVALVALGGCVMDGDGAAPASGGRYAAGHFAAKAVLHSATGGVIGTATAQEADGGLTVTIEAAGLTPGKHGVHVHMVGKCEAPDFASAGGHWNPTAHQHGSMNPAGPHAGDLPNLVAGADGKARLSFRLAGGTYEGLLDQDGSAMVIHAGEDDLRTDPSGNSGGRFACGVFEAL